MDTVSKELSSNFRDSAFISRSSTGWSLNRFCAVSRSFFEMSIPMKLS